MQTSPTPQPARPPSRRLRIDGRTRWVPDVRELFRARQLLLLLSRRDITVKYRQTIVGAIWIFAGPLSSAGLFSFVFGSVADLSSGDIPYFAFSYAGLLGWNLFSTAINGTSNALTSNSALVTKIYFPRLTLPLSALASAVINAAISFVVMLGLLAIFDVGFTWRLVTVPAWMTLALLLAVGAGLILGSFAVTYRDVSYIAQVLIPLLMFLTPVVYALDEVPSDAQDLYLLNPIATVIEGFRWSLLGQGTIEMWALGYTTAFAVVTIVVGSVVFTRLEWKFADVI